MTWDNGEMYRELCRLASDLEIKSYGYSSRSNDYSFSSEEYEYVPTALTSRQPRFGSSSNSTPRVSSFRSQQYEFDPGWIHDQSPPSNNRQTKEFYRARLRRDLDKNSAADVTYEDFESNALKQIPDVLSRTKRHLRHDSIPTQGMEFGTLLASAVPGVKAVLPRATSGLGGERLYPEAFGLKEKHQDDDFKRSLRKASGRDRESIAKKAEKYQRKQMLKPAKKEAKQELGEWLHEKAVDAYDAVHTAYPQVTEDAADMFVSASSHVKGMGHPLVHMGIMGKHAWQGADDVSKRLDKLADISEKQAKPVHEKIVRKEARRLWSGRKSKGKTSDKARGTPISSDTVRYA